jgi:hypothetical protein
MDQGRIVEDGPPAELRRHGGLFAQLWRLQTDPTARAAARSWTNWHAAAEPGARRA